MSDLLISALHGADDKTPINGARRRGAPAAVGPAEDSDTASASPLAAAHDHEVAQGSDSANARKIRAMRETIELRTATAGYHRELAVLQRDRSRLDVLSATEERLERRAARRVRGLSRRHDVATAVAAARLDGRGRRAERQLARADASDQVWQRRALARRRRLLDPTSRLASLQRTHVGVSLVLMAVAVAGIAWTSMGVHDALVGPDGTPLAYIVEPLFSMPLLVIMTLHARAAQWGRTFPAPENRTRIRLLEAFLLLATMTINAAPVLPVLGTWHNVTTLLGHLAPPVLIVVAIVLQPLAAAFLAATSRKLTSTSPTRAPPGSQPTPSTPSPSSPRSAPRSRAGSWSCGRRPGCPASRRSAATSAARSAAPRVCTTRSSCWPAATAPTPARLR